MSLICASCFNFIVLSDTKDHYGICSQCSNEKPKDELMKAAKFIKESKK